MYFHEWLVRERKLTQKSAKNYSWAVFCYLSKKIGVNLATVDDSSLLDELGKRLFKTLRLLRQTGVERACINAA